MPGRLPTNVDILIGKHIRAARQKKGVSAAQLASVIGITEQGLNGYEIARVRTSAATLHKIARVLDTPISYFYRGA